MMYEKQAVCVTGRFRSRSDGGGSGERKEKGEGGQSKERGRRARLREGKPDCRPERKPPPCCEILIYSNFK